MTITILFKSGKEVSVKCHNAATTRDKMTGRVEHINFDGIEENKIMDLDFEEIAAIYRKVSDEDKE